MAELPIAPQSGMGAPAAPSLDSGLRRNDEVGGGNDEVGIYSRTNRSCRLMPAHQGGKIGCIGWWGSSSVIATTRTSPLDSGLRRNDELGGRNDESGDLFSYQ